MTRQQHGLENEAQANPKERPLSIRPYMIDGRPFTPGWKPVHAGFEGECRLTNGVNPWKYDWTRVEHDRVIVPHPAYPNQRHDATVYEILVSGQRIRFAMDELSNGVYGFYEPTGSPPSV